MDKATKVIRRSGTKLRGYTGRHKNLNVLIGQLGDCRSTFKSFISAQQTFTDDMVVWGGENDNRAIQDVCAYLTELSFLWTEVQKEFADRLREFRTQFELILEGERHVDQSRELYGSRETREIKCRKELSKTVMRGGVGEEMKLMEERVAQAEKGKDLAYLEVVDRIKENETVKLIRFREGLRKLSTAYVALGEKCQTIFTAYNSVSSSLPDVHNSDLEGVRYTGSRESAALVQRVKEQILSYDIAPSTSSNGQSEGQYVDLPQEKLPPVPPKSSRSSKADIANSKRLEANSIPSKPEQPKPGENDLPPSYSEVFGEGGKSPAGACGYTPKPTSNGESSEKNLQTPIEVAHPRHLTRFDRSESWGVTPPSAPNNSTRGELHRANTDRVDGPVLYPAVPSDSDRRVVNRGSDESISFRRSDSISSTHRPVSVYDDERLNRIVRNRTQRSSSFDKHIKTKKLSMKSLSVAGNAISDFLGWNQMKKYEYPSNPDYKQQQRRDSADVYIPHGVLPEEMQRISESDKDCPTTPVNRIKVHDNNKNSFSPDKEKAKALSAKFNGKLKLKEELPVPPCLSNEIETNNSTSVEKAAREKSNSKETGLNNTTDFNSSESKDLIDLDTSGNVTEQTSTKNDLGTPVVARENETGVPNIVDGDLNKLAIPRNKKVNPSTNPFIEDNNPFIDDSDSEGKEENKRAYEW